MIPPVILESVKQSLAESIAKLEPFNSEAEPIVALLTLAKREVEKLDYYQKEGK